MASRSRAVAAMEGSGAAAGVRRPPKQMAIRCKPLLTTMQGRTRARSPLARQEPVAARRQLARAREERLHLSVERLRLRRANAAAGAQVGQARQQVAGLEQVLVCQEQ